MDEYDHLRRLWNILRERQQILEEKLATFGSANTPPHYLIDMSKVRSDLAEVEARLARVGRQNAVINNLPRLAPYFVGRKQEIEGCLEALRLQDRVWGVSIYGMGGIGKTALALEVAHRAYKAALFDAYLYASAKTAHLSPAGERQETLAPSSLDAFIREFARLLHAPEGVYISSAIERRQSLLDNLRGLRVLLIWDNLETLTSDECASIVQFIRELPNTNKAIITSRHRNMSDGAKIIHLNELTRDEAFDA